MGLEQFLYVSATGFTSNVYKRNTYPEADSVMVRIKENLDVSPTM